MANPNEALQEFLAMTEQECQVAEDYEDEIKQAGATHVYVKRNENDPNRIELWADTHEDVQNATEAYVELCNQHIDERGN